MFGKEKKANYFYESFYDLATYAVSCFDALATGIKDFGPNLNLEEFKNNVHKFEHEADDKKQEYEENLAKEFITPIDREDIFLLLDAIDNLTDSIDEISYKMYLRNYKALPPKTMIFVEETKQCLNHLMEVLKNFKHVTNKDIIYPLIQVVLADETNMDRLYEREVHAL